MRGVGVLLGVAFAFVASSPGQAAWLMDGVDATHANHLRDEGPAWGDLAFDLPLPNRPARAPPVILERTMYVLMDPADPPAPREVSLLRVGLDDARVEELARVSAAINVQFRAIASDGERLFVSTSEGVTTFDLHGRELWRWDALPLLVPGHPRGGCRQLLVHEGSVLAACQTANQNVTGATDVPSPFTSPFLGELHVIRLDARTGGVTWVWTGDEAALAAALTDQRVEPPSVGPAPATHTISNLVGMALAGPTLAAQITATTSYQTPMPPSGDRLGGGTPRTFLFGLSYETGAQQWGKAGEPAPQALSPGPVVSSVLVTGNPAGSESVLYTKLGGLVARNVGTGNPIWNQTLGLEDYDPVSSSSGITLAEDAVYAASASTLYRFDLDNHENGWRTSLDPARNQRFGSALILVGEVLYATAFLPALGGDGLYAYRATDGELLWDRPVNGTYAFAVGEGVAVIADTETSSLHVFGRTGASILLSPSVSDAYPAPDAEVVVDLSGAVAGVAGPATEFAAEWGDGTTTMWQASPRLAHAYASAGDHEARVMARNAANQTASEALTFHVGTARPNVVSRAFSPENQNATFFAIGLALTGAGALVGLLRVRRQRDVLHKELRALDHLSRAVRDRPTELDGGLVERRKRMVALLAEGKLTDGQFAVLEKRIDEIQRAERLGTIDERFRFLPHGLAMDIREALADGRITRLEHQQILAVLEADASLTPEQKAVVRARVEAWFTNDGGGRG